jgi:probable HAF family extracellular repeat protein
VDRGSPQPLMVRAEFGCRSTLAEPSGGAHSMLCRAMMRAHISIPNKRIVFGLFSALLVLAVSNLLGQATITPLPTLGGSAMQPTALNNAGMVTGYARTAQDLAQHAFLYNNGIMKDLGLTGPGPEVAWDVNDDGDVVGDFWTSDSQQHAFYWYQGAMLDLGTLGGTWSSSVAVNNAGMIAGNSWTKGDQATHAFLARGTTLTDLGTLGGSSSYAASLSEDGGVAGESYTANDPMSHAFLFSGGTMHDLGTLGGTYSSAFALNNFAQVAGESWTADGGTHGFLYTAGSMTDLGTLGGTYSTVYGINDGGQVIGDSTLSQDHDMHAFIYDNGHMTDLGTVGGSYSSAYAINNRGQVVGEAANAAGSWVAFLWQDGVMKDLNSLLPDGSGWVLDSAQFINDAGQIVGFGTLNGEFCWFFLTLPSSSFSNHSPVAEAGPDQTVECPATRIQLDGSKSSDPDGDPLTYEWRLNDAVLGREATASVSLSPGTYTIELIVTDQSGAQAQDSLTVTVVDTTPPTASIAPSFTVDADSTCQALVPDLTASVEASDTCPPAKQLAVTQTPLAGSAVGLGIHQVTVTVTDQAGNSAIVKTSLVVNDATAPQIRAITVSPAELFPANGKMVPIRVTVDATDNCDPALTCEIVSIASDEPVTGVGNKTSPDWEITGRLTANLRAEHAAGSQARTYILEVRCQDAAGNSSTGTVAVRVSKSGKKTK